MTVKNRQILPPIVLDNLDAIRSLAEQFEVERLEIFGSIMTEAFDPARSDIDFLVTYPQDYDFGPWLGRVQELEERLSTTVGHPVDLVMASALRRERFRQFAESTRRVLFDATTDRTVA